MVATVDYCSYFSSCTSILPVTTAEMVVLWSLVLVMFRFFACSPVQATHRLNHRVHREHRDGTEFRMDIDISDSSELLYLSGGSLCPLCSLWFYFFLLARTGCLEIEPRRR